MNETVKTLIEKYIQEIDEDNYSNIIVAAAEKGFESVVELRRVLIEGTIDITIFDKQCADMIKIAKLAQEIAKLTK